MHNGYVHKCRKLKLLSRKNNFIIPELPLYYFSQRVKLKISDHKTVLFFIVSPVGDKSPNNKNFIAFYGRII